MAVSKNGGTPMSRSRVIVLGASLVCSVLNTMWPVSEACTAISAVSRSRISPTRILSGSCRRIDRRHWAKVLPIDASIGTWIDAVDVVFDRVFGGDELVLDDVQFVEAPRRAWWSCREPVGPVTSTMPLGLRITSRN